MLTEIKEHEHITDSGKIVNSLTLFHNKALDVNQL